jgi:hypothetical protein
MYKNVLLTVKEINLLSGILDQYISQNSSNKSIQLTNLTILSNTLNRVIDYKKPPIIS